MMQLRTAIIDDIAADAERLEYALRTAAAQQTALSCEYFGSGDALLEHFAPGKYEMVFLDICMEGTNGIETARALREADKRLLIVFVTSSSEYVWDSFPMHPFDYLLKPYANDRVAKLLQDALHALEKVEPELEVHVARRIMRLPFGKIHFATSQNHCVSIVTDDGECKASELFSYIQEQLSQDPRFLACNRGIILNMDKALRFENDQIQMLNGASFPVRQKDKGRLFTQFTQYQFRRMRSRF